VKGNRDRQTESGWVSKEVVCWSGRI
jgi:hypothetical protein